MKFDGLHEGYSTESRGPSYGIQKYSRNWFYQHQGNDSILSIWGNIEKGRITVYRKSGVMEVYNFDNGEFLNKQTVHREIEDINDSLTNAVFKSNDGRDDEMEFKETAQNDFMSAHIDKISEALVAVQAEVENVSKDKQGYGYKYAELSQVLKATLPLLTKNNISLVQLPGNDGEKVSLKTVLMHTSGQWISSTIIMPVEKGKMSFAQASGSIITYARRYALCAMVGLTQEDNDAYSEEKIDKPIQKATYQKPLNKEHVDGEDLSTPIDESQVEKLRELLANSKPLLDKVLELSRVRFLEDIPIDKYDKAVAYIQTKRTGT